MFPRPGRAEALATLAHELQPALLMPMGLSSKINGSAMSPSVSPKPPSLGMM
jgi:hypothetical protein